jgi:hypothetical protein
MSSLVRKKTDNVNTVYSIYNAKKNENGFTNESQEITFITSALINCGLEDVTSIDAKWQIYVQNPPLCRVSDTQMYLSFLVSLVVKHHEHNDTYEVLDD